MMLGAVSEDQTSVKSEDSLSGRAKFLCSYGGRIMPRPHDNQLRYVGGETRILSVSRAVVFGDLMTKLKRLCPFENVILKYQLPEEDLDALVSVISEEDLENMMEEYDRVEAKDSTSRLRLFLFPVAKQDVGADPDHRFVDAINGVYRKVMAEPVGTLPVEEQHRKNFVLLHHPLGVQDRAQVIPATPAMVAQLPPLHHQPQVQPQVLPVQAHQVLPHLPLPVAPSVVPMSNVVAAAAPTKIFAAPAAVPAVVPAVVPTPSVVRAPSPASVVPQVLAGRTVMPQTAFVAPVASGKPVPPSSTYVPLVDVSRGVLPKGMVLRQFSVEDDRSESPSSQSSLVNDERRDSSDMIDLDNISNRGRVFDASDFERLRLEKVQENMVMQHLPAEAKMIRSNMEAVPVPVQVFIPGKALEQGIPRAASAPPLQSVDVATAIPAAPAQLYHQRQQFSDRSEPHLVHQQENALPRCIASDVLVERFPSPLPRPSNPVRPQQELQVGQLHIDPATQLLQQKPMKMVPQVVAVNPYKAP